MYERRGGSDPTIFINRRSFKSPPTTSGAAIADLIGVPHDNAVVERETPEGLTDVSLDEPLSIKDGDAFLVTRQYIMGGRRPDRVTDDTRR